MRLATGEKVMTRLDASFAAPGAFGFTLRRFYRSREGAAPLAGRKLDFGNWSSNWEARVEKFGAELIETTGDLSSLVFLGDGQGGYLPCPRTGRRPAVLADGAVEITDLGGSSRTYDPDTGRLRVLRDRNGNTFTVDTDPATGAITRVTDPVGRVVAYQTDADGRVTAMTLPGDPARSTFTYGYTPEGFLAYTEDPLGNRLEYGYDQDGRLTSRRNALGYTWAWQYDADGRVTRGVDEAGGAEGFEYFPDHTVLTDQEGNGWKFFFDPQGRIVRQEAPDDSATAFAWDAQGLLVRHTDEAGRAVDFARDGLLTSGRSDAAGARSWDRDPATGHVTAIREVDGAETTFAYDAAGNLLRRVAPTGEVTTFTYNARGQVLTVTAPGSGTTTHTYDPQGNRIRTEDDAGHVTQFEYDALSRVVAVTDPLGRRTATEYLLHSVVSATVDPVGGRRETEYDALYRPIVQRDVDGAETKTTYGMVSGAVVVTATEDAAGRVTRFEYDSRARRVATVAPGGARTETTYDSRGRAVETKGPLGAVRRSVYNPDGTLAKSVSPAGHETTYAYDALGRQVAATDALGQVTQTVYNPRGMVTETVAADGATTRFEHDAAGRVVRTVSPLGAESRSVYDAAGRLAETVDPLGEATRFEYDALGRQVRVIDPAGAVTETVYNDDGSVAARVDALGRRTEFAYDALGRQTHVTDPLGFTRVTRYHPDGAVAETEDPLGRVTSYSYDALGRVVAVRDPLGFEVRNEYDLAGNRARLVDENGHATRFEYDLANRLVATVDALGRRRAVAYDLEGNRVTETNARADAHQLRYDALNRLVEKVLPEGVETYAYDPAGRRALAQNDAVGEVYSYDADGRLVAKNDVVRGFSRSRLYDPVGRLKSAVDTYGRTTRREYDPRGLLVMIEDHRGAAYRFGYDAAGRLTDLERPNGVGTTWDYDAGGRVRAITHRDIEGGTTLASFEYLRDAVGNPVRETQTRLAERAVTEYRYDARDQLVAAEVVSTSDPDLKGFRNIEYTYDPAGNRLTRTVDGVRQEYRYNAANELVAVDDLALEYDLDGNLVREELTPRKARLYEYDSENNLVGISLETGARKRKRRRTWTYEYRYSPDGLKVAVEKRVTFDRRKHRPKCAWWYPWRFKKALKKWARSRGEKWGRRPKWWKKPRRGAQAAEDHHGEVGFVRMEDRFWMGGSVVEDRRARDPLSDGYDPQVIRERSFLRGPGGVLAEMRSRLKDETRREQPRLDQVYLGDVLGSTIAVLDNDGETKQWFSYSPFGEMKPDWSSLKYKNCRRWWRKNHRKKKRSRDKSTTFTYTGLLRERVPGDDDQIFSAQYRHLRPSLGRWMKADPAGDVDGPNLYRYGPGSPFSGTDISGLAWDWGVVKGLLLSKPGGIGARALNEWAHGAQPKQLPLGNGNGLVLPLPSYPETPAPRWTSLEFILSDKLSNEGAAAWFVHEARHIEDWRIALTKGGSLAPQKNCEQGHRLVSKRQRQDWEFEANWGMVTFMDGFTSEQRTSAGREALTVRRKFGKSANNRARRRGDRPSADDFIDRTYSYYSDLEVNCATRWPLRIAGAGLPVNPSAQKAGR